jgi:hypothetical protein
MSVLDLIREYDNSLKVIPSLVTAVKHKTQEQSSQGNKIIKIKSNILVDTDIKLN